MRTFGFLAAALVLALAILVAGMPHHEPAEADTTVATAQHSHGPHATGCDDVSGEAAIGDHCSVVSNVDLLTPAIGSPVRPGSEPPAFHRDSALVQADISGWKRPPRSV